MLCAQCQDSARLYFDCNLVQNSQFGLRKRNFDDIAKGNERIVESLRGDLIVEPTNVDCSLLPRLIRHCRSNNFFHMSIRAFQQ